MSAGEEQQSEAQSTEVQGGSLLEEAIAATKQTERSRAEDLIRTLVEEVNKGTVSMSKDMSRTITSGIEAIDAVISNRRSRTDE